MHDAPGPWTRENRRGRAIVIDADRNEVCEAFAAPALIAAAPEMLAALQLLVCGDGQPDECARAMRAARAAIAKATGDDHA